ncbi:MAG: DUF4129 domain-containing protein [Clostridiales bacterium]|jgi:hypothetical protein|nr:DUF4129 domain-containing protein [Clostridiales bacterium]
MRFPKEFFRTFVPVLADITVLLCVYSRLSITNLSYGYETNEMIQIPIALFLLCAAAMSALNCLLARREYTMSRVAMGNLGLAVICEFVLLPRLGNASGALAYVFCAILFVYPVLRSLYLAYNPVGVNTMMVYSQLAFFGIGIFLCMQQDEAFRSGIGLNALCIVSQGLNLGLLSYLRSEGRRKYSENGRSASAWAFVISSAGVAAALSVVLLFLTLPGTKESILRILSSFKGFFFWIARVILRFFAYIASLFPNSQAQTLSGTGIGLVPMPSEGRGAVSPGWVPLILLGVFAMVALYRAFKYRRGNRLARGNVVAESVSELSLPIFLKDLFARINSRLRFYWLLITHFREPAGIFIRLEYRSKRRGCPRLPGQTPREFIEMLIRHSPDEEKDARDAFAELAKQMDILCFSNNLSGLSPYRSLNGSLPSAQAHAMLRSVRRR